MRNVRIRVAYDGSKFFGWQRQDGFESVQEAIEEALCGLVGSPVVVRGSGRTDTGVHALGQVAHFHVDTRLGDERLCFALNAHLPEGVVVQRLETCRDDFHAQRDARGKRYAYRVHTSQFRPPFGRQFVHWVRDPLDLTAMRAAASTLLGEHDFKAFANAGSPRKTTVRRLSAVHIVARRSGLVLVVQGNGFLYNMVRTIAGTLIEVGRGRRAAGEMAAILESRDRDRAGPTAPPEGLYLLRALYDEPCFVGRAEVPRGFPGVFQA